MRAASFILAAVVSIHSLPFHASSTQPLPPNEPPRDESREIVVSLAVPPRGTRLEQARERFRARAASLGLEVAASLGDALAANATGSAAPWTAAAPSATRLAKAAPDLFGLDPARVLLLRARDAASARLAAASLAGDASVEWLEPELSREAAEFPFDGSLPDDPLLRETRQWALWNAGAAGAAHGTAGADLGALEAWKSSCGSNDVILALADTGVDPHHPDLDRVMPDGSSRLVFGRDVSLDFAGSWADSNVHGTAVAGVMAALTNDGAHFDSLGVAGVCGGDGRANAGCRLVPIKIAPGHSAGSTSFEIASAIVYAASVGARVLNLSFAGSGDSGLERRALYYALTHGCVVVAAAGNLGTSAPTAPQYPAAYAAEGLCIQAGASDANDKRAAFSSYGPGLDLVAPGVELWTTALTYPNAYGARWPGYLTGSGTSFAAPCVSGAAGLLLARRPELSDVDLQHVLRESAHDVGAPGVDAETGWGRLDAAAALRAVGPAIGIAHDERVAIARPTGIFGTLAVLADSFGSFDRATWWTGRIAEQVEVSVSLALPDSFLDSARVWPRVGGTMALASGFRLTHFAPWAEVTAHDGRRVTLRGYVYRLPQAAPDSLDAWLPLPPDEARIAFTILGPVDRSPRTSVSASSTRRPALRVTPNPAREKCHVFGPPGSRILLLDLAGRVIRRASLDPVRGTFDWDRRDDFGRRVHPGLYFIAREGVSHAAEPASIPLRFVLLE